MSTSSVQPPFEIFTDIDGQPLEDGYIWLGTAGLPAISNPITAYWNAAGTIAAVQPIRTIGGYPMDAGTPARLYVTSSDYSILVQNKNGSSIYSSLNATERYSSALVTFLQAGANAVQRTAQSKMRDIVSVKDFGAVGDGATDDTAAIQAAIDAINARGGGAIYFPSTGSFYAVTQTFTVGSNTMLFGDGADSSHVKWTSAPGPTPNYSGGPNNGRRGFINKNYAGGNSYISFSKLKLDFSLVVGALTFARQLIYFYNCKHTSVTSCHIMTDGGAVCNVKTKDYIVKENYCEQVGTYGSSDGMIDQWDGSQNGTIIDNIIEGKNLTRWGILITATDTNGLATGTPCKNFLISRNRISNTYFASFSPMGRKDGCFDIVFSQNEINGNLSSLGYYAALDVRAVTGIIIANNIIQNTTKAGIILGREGALGTYTYENNYNISIIGNILKNIGQFVAIECQSQFVENINIVGNVVDGGSYEWAIAQVGGTTVTKQNIVGNYLKQGSLGIVTPESLVNINWRDNLGNINHFISGINNTPNTKTSMAFFSNGINFLNNANSSSFLISTTPTAVNRVQVEAANTLNPVTIRADGSDANVDMLIAAKGTGMVRYGTHAAITTETLSGFIQIKDSAGNVRKLAVVS